MTSIPLETRGGGLRGGVALSANQREETGREREGARDSVNVPEEGKELEQAVAEGGVVPVQRTMCVQEPLHRELASHCLKPAWFQNQLTIRTLFARRMPRCFRLVFKENCKELHVQQNEQHQTG